MTTHDTPKKLIERFLGDAPASAVEAELAKFQLLAPATRKIVIERLKVVNDVFELGRPTRSEIERAAAKLEIKRANFYRLVARAREHGPVAGFAPRTRVVPTTSTAERGLHALAEQAIAAVLEAKPAAPLIDFLEAIEKAYEGSRAKRPAETAVRRRIAVLRRPGGLRDKDAWKAGREFGRKVLVDQSAVSSKTYDIDGNVALVFIIDIDTRLIIGCGQSPLDDLTLGLRRAIQHARASASSLVIGRFAASTAPDEVRWIVPDEVLEDSDEWARALIIGDTAAVMTGSRRHGQLLVRLMGNEFGPFTLMPRVLAGEVERQAQANTDMVDLTSAIETTATEWNYRVIEAASGLEPTQDQAERRRRLASWRKLQSQSAVEALVESVVHPFEDALNERDRLRSEDAARP